MTLDQSAASRKSAPKQKKTYGKNVKSHISGWFGRDLWNAVEPADSKKKKEKEKEEKEKDKRRSVEEDEDANIEKQLAREASERQLLGETKPEDEKWKSDTRPKSIASIESLNTDDIPGTPEHEELEANILALLDGIQNLDVAEAPTALPADDSDDDDEETNMFNSASAVREELDHKSIKENSDKENDEPSFPGPGSSRASRKRSSDALREALKERSISPERDSEPLESLIESPARKNGVRKKGSLVHRMSVGSPVTSPLKKETMAPEAVRVEDIKVWEDTDGENTLGKTESSRTLAEARNKLKEKIPVIEILDSEDEREDEHRRKNIQKAVKAEPVEPPARKKAPVVETPAIISQQETSHEEQYDSDESELTLQGDYRSSDFLPVDDLLRICTVPRIVDFTTHIDTILTTSAITKLGEASYSEVFLQLTPTPTFTTATVLKIIPFGGADQCALPSIIQEVSITDSMGLIPGYIGFRGAYVVRGVFPQALMDEWDAYEEERGSENERPEFYEESQLFAVIMLEMGGRDLEHFELRGWEEANSVFWQVAIALGRGEREREFEHRDLHFGNIVIRREPDEEEIENWNVDEDENQTPENLLSKLSLNEAEVQVPDNLLSKLSLDDAERQKPELKVSLIDYTLSRAICGATLASMHVQHAPLDDPALFTGKGDYQFDIYRFMRTHVSSGLVPPDEEDIDWNVYAPKTNVFWLHYLTNILLNKKGIPRPAARGRFAASEVEKKAYKELEQVAKLIDPRKKRFGGKWEATCAGDLVEWAVEQGIVDEGVWGWEEVEEEEDDE